MNTALLLSSLDHTSREEGRRKKLKIFFIHKPIKNEENTGCRVSSLKLPSTSKNKTQQHNSCSQLRKGS